MAQAPLAMVEVGDEVLDIAGQAQALDKGALRLFARSTNGRENAGCLPRECRERRGERYRGLPARHSALPCRGGEQRLVNGCCAAPHGKQLLRGELAHRAGRAQLLRDELEIGITAFPEPAEGRTHGDPHPEVRVLDRLAQLRQCGTSRVPERAEKLRGPLSHLTVVGQHERRRRAHGQSFAQKILPERRRGGHARHVGPSRPGGRHGLGQPHGGRAEPQKRRRRPRKRPRRATPRLLIAVFLVGVGRKTHMTRNLDPCHGVRRIAGPSSPMRRGRSAAMRSQN